MAHNCRLDIHNKKIKGDTMQMEAVHHIVAGTAYPLPYILIGFPGKIHRYIVQKTRT